jgi:hypothetical protein
MYKVSYVGGRKRAKIVPRKDDFFADTPKRPIKHSKRARPKLEKSTVRRAEIPENPFLKIEEYAMKVLKSKDRKRVEEELKNHFGQMATSHLKGGNFLKRAFKKVGAIVSNATNRVKGFFTGRDKLRPTARRVMEQHGNEEISSITVCREPIMKGVEKFMNVVSVGGINRAKQDLQYDDLFHLYMFIKTKNGTSIRNEKNEVINIEVKQMDSNPKRETREITVNKPLTLNEFIENTSKYMGDKFLSYSASSNNCQNYIDACLSGNQLNTPELKKFVMQDSDKIFKHLPSWLRPFSDKLTGLAGRIDVLKNGMGRKRRIKKIGGSSVPLPLGRPTPRGIMKPFVPQV